MVYVVAIETFQLTHIPAQLSRSDSLTIRLFIVKRVRLNYRPLVIRYDDREAGLADLARRLGVDLEP